MRLSSDSNAATVQGSVEPEGTRDLSLCQGCHGGGELMISRGEELLSGPGRAALGARQRPTQ